MERLRQVRVHRLRPDGATAPAEEDWLATEEGLELRVNHRPLTVLMRTPGNDEDLLLGFLATEGVVRARADVERVHVLLNPADPARGHIIDAVLAPEALARAQPSGRAFFASSSCGVCGRNRIEDLEIRAPPVTSALKVRGHVLHALPAALRAAQELFESTGGLHAAALCDAEGRILAAREDVGRHNAVDKVIGWAFREGRLPLTNALLVVSSRASYDILQKAIVAGIPLVAVIGAPSSLAVRLAERFNVTLVGFLKESSMNVYTHPERVLP